MPPRTASRDAALDFLAGGGEMGALMRSKDWSASPIGDPSTWPQSLRTAISMCLNSRFPMFIWWGPELAMLYNDGYVPMLGDKHPASLGSSGPKVWAEIWDVIGPLMSTVLTEGTATWSEDQLLLTTRAGYEEETYFTFSYSPVIDESGGIGGIFCAVTETTGRVIGERRLRTLARISAGTGSGDPFAAGRAAVDAMATNPDDLPFVLLCAVGDDARVEDVAATGDKDGVETVKLDLDIGVGRPMWALELGISPRRAFDDDYRQFCELVAAAVTAELRTATALQEQRRRAEELAELDRAKTDFFSNISHEFRTPLTLLLAPLEDELGRRAGDDSEGLELAHRNAMRLMRLVNTLLDFSRAEAGRSTAELRPADLSTLTAELAALFTPAIERAGLEFEVVCEPLPRPVDLDPDLWERIVLNLLSNALKYTFEGSIALRVGEAGGHAVVTVADTGQGIPEGELPRLFERFHRVQGVRARTHEGSGIGLALVHDLVGLHGGTVAVASSDGEGTTFTVTLPFSDAAASEVTPSPPSGLASAYLEEALRWDLPADGEPPRGGRHRSGGYRVLVVDDNADMRDYIASLLSADYDVTTAGDGIAALEALYREHFDLVVSDVMMPRVDGLELLARIRADDELHSLPVLLVSARAGNEAAVEGLDKGADDYVIKPFTATELVARVRANLELSRVRNAEAQRQRTHATRMQELYVREHRAAETLQRSLLPRALPAESFLDLAARYEPAEDAALIGGDWYDAVILGDGTLVLTIGDVAGHGLEAAAVMGQLRSAARGYALSGESPAELLAVLNTLVWTLDTPPMVTCQVMAVAPDRLSLRYACAGHPVAFTWRPGDGEARPMVAPGGPPLGASRMTAYVETSIELPPRTHLALYTDGLVERRGEAIETGLGRLRSALVADAGSLDDLVRAVVLALRPPDGYRDDVALLVAAFPEVGAREFTIEQPASPTSLVRVRRAIRRWLLANGVSDALTYELLVAVNEAASNAIEHAFGPGRGSYTASVSRDERAVTLTIRDAGKWREPRGQYRGRGLAVIEALMDEVEVVHDQHGTVVTMKRSLDA